MRRSTGQTMIVLLDSTVLIEALRSNKQMRAALAGITSVGHRLSTSAVNVGEVYGGMRAGEEARTEAFLSSLECYPVTWSIARRAGGLQNEWKRRGRTLTLVDMVVAATAIEYGTVLMTDNRRDFPMPEIQFYP